MVAILECLTASADDLEETSVPVPQHGLPAVPGTSAIPWWTGVPGLDPDCRVDDWAQAASFAAMACAAQVLGTGAGRADWWRSAKSAPAAKWLRWLLEATHEGDARKRILALRLICERAAVIDDDHILDAAQSLHAACTPGARLR